MLRSPFFALLLVVAAALPAGAQQPPPDTIRVDTLRAAPSRDTIPGDTIRRDTIPGDTIRRPGAGPDTLAAADPGALEARGDTAQVDTIFYNLPRMDGEGPVGWREGAWSWDHDAIMASGAVSLADLVAEVPGMIPLLAGDYGTPSAVTAFGLGGGRVRILRDGFEVIPLGGGVTDLSSVGLGGISHVRLERSMGELVIDMVSYEFNDGRPYSLVEAGTGDLNTNLFRGTFANPTALGGSVAVALERADSRGARGDEEGNVTGSWLRYQLHRGDAAGLALDFRRVGSESAATAYASPLTRTDWTIRGRAELLPGLRAEAYWGKSSLKVEDEDSVYARDGGDRSQAGVRALFRQGPLSAAGAYRRFGGDELPSSRLDLSAGLDDPRVGGVTGGFTRASWPGTSTSAKQLRGWTRPVLGFSLFGSWESGSFGARTFPVRGPIPPDTTTVEEPAEPDSTAVEPIPDPLFRATDRTTTRYGAQWAWRSFALSGARLKIETDSLLPLGFEPDRGQPALAGGTREGWEVWGRLPTPVSGLHLEGSLQQWDQDWSYMPRRTYRGAFVFHRQYLESGNLEWWWTLGVRGHDPMNVRQVVGEEMDDEGNVLGPELGWVPFYQNWYARIQLRIVSVRIFIGWENFTIRRNLQNVPDRLLPITRTFYGLRWTLWN